MPVYRFQIESQLLYQTLQKNPNPNRSLTYLLIPTISRLKPVGVSRSVRLCWILMSSLKSLSRILEPGRILSTQPMVRPTGNMTPIVSSCSSSSKYSRPCKRIFEIAEMFMVLFSNGLMGSVTLDYYVFVTTGARIKGLGPRLFREMAEVAKFG